MHKRHLLIASVLGALSVILGAFGAHGLKEHVPPATLDIFKTGVQYQVYHVFALFITAILGDHYEKRLLKLAGTFFLYGIILFSGSLYMITLFSALDIQTNKVLGFLTPAGGLLFIAGWILLFTGIIKKKSQQGT